MLGHTTLLREANEPCKLKQANQNSAPIFESVAPTFFHPASGVGVGGHVHGPEPRHVNISLSSGIGSCNSCTNFEVRMSEDFVPVQDNRIGTEGNHPSASGYINSGKLSDVTIDCRNLCPSPSFFVVETLPIERGS